MDEVAGASAKGCMSYFQFQKLFVILDRPGSHLTHMFVCLFISLFNLMLNVHGKELSFCHLLRRLSTTTHTVPGQASRR